MARLLECVTLLGDVADRAEAAQGLEKVEQRRVRRLELALQRVGRRLQKLGDLPRILKLTRCENDEADVVLSASAGTSGHLLKLICRERPPALITASIGVADDDRSGREIDARGDGRGGKDGVQQSGRHHFLDKKLPCRNVPGVVRGNAVVDEYLDVLVLEHFGMHFRERIEEQLPLLELFRVGTLRAVGGDLRGRFVALSPRR